MASYRGECMFKTVWCMKEVESCNAEEIETGDKLKENSHFERVAGNQYKVILIDHL